MIDRGEPGGRVVTIPQPAWRLVLSGLLALAFFLLAAIELGDLLAHDPASIRVRTAQVPVTGLSRWICIGTVAVFSLLPPSFVAFYARMPEFAIETIGIRRPGRRGKPATSWNVWPVTILTWDKVRYCSWGRYPPGTLNIQTTEERLFVRIPGRFRAEVESALRAFGKWQE